MPTQKNILVMIGVMAVFFILIGCSACPTSSTASVPIVDNSNPPADNNSSDVADDTGGNTGGYDTEPAIENPKYDDDVPNEESPNYND